MMLLQFFFLALGIQMVFFIYAAWKRTDTVTDLSYGLTFIVLAWLAYVNSTRTASVLLLVVLITTWGLRLILYLFGRIRAIKKDARFNGIRENFWKFFSFWFFQGIAVWVIMLPVILFVFGRYGSEDITLWQGLFAGVVLAGIVIEGIADYQKFTFKSDPRNKGKWIQSGLWKYSRHPNYFGEMIVWWGVYFLALPSFQGIEVLSVLSPLFITYLLLAVTGVPTLEKKYDEQYKNDPAYATYKRETPMILPLPRMR